MEAHRSFEPQKTSVNRRSFLSGSVAALMASATNSTWAGLAAGDVSAERISAMYVSLEGSDSDLGTIDRPLRTLKAAQAAVRTLRKNSVGAIAVYLRQGTYYLDETIVFTVADSGEQEVEVTYAPYPGERVVLSGGTRISPQWRRYRGGIFQTYVPAGTRTDQFFVNGQRQILARYPNYDPQAKYLNGCSPDAIGPDRVKTWSNPKGGYIHALHQYLWGDMHFEITGKDAQGNLTYEGGWQNNRPKPMHAQYRFVENIFEELDSPGEWFLDETKSILYYYPAAGLDLSNAKPRFENRLNAKWKPDYNPRLRINYGDVARV